MKIFTKILIGVLAAALIAFLWFLMLPEPVQGLTDRKDYRLGDPLEISIKNNLGRAVCFSSCYPYLAEKQNAEGEWEQYSYESCPAADAAADCVPAGAAKKFRLMLSDIDGGLNRLKLPVCVNCAPGQDFKADSVLHSNTFKVE